MALYISFAETGVEGTSRLPLILLSNRNPSKEYIDKMPSGKDTKALAAKQRACPKQKAAQEGDPMHWRASITFINSSDLSSRMIKAVVFDLWKTLGEKNISVSGEFCKHFGLKKTPEFMRRYEESIQLEEWDTMEAMAKHMLSYLGVPVTDDGVRFVVRIMQEGIEDSQLIAGRRELLSDLHKTCKIGLLSNTAVFEAGALEKWGVAELFDVVVYSWQLGSLKPANKNFAMVLEKLGLSASECVFVDDNDANLAAAQEFGWHVLKSAGSDELRKGLRGLGVRL
jgi:HAD superfamily hydrolase (TIGR01509 family)